MPVSLMVRVPVTVVPLSFALTGLNVIETSQLPPLPASVPRQFWLALYMVPVVAIWLISIATLVLLVRVTVLATEVPTWTLPKESARGWYFRVPRAGLRSGLSEPAAKTGSVLISIRE